MLSLSVNDIELNQSPINKEIAIENLAKNLYEKGYVEKTYGGGMQAREVQHSTYLGNGIAIPHGTLETRSLVKKTGVQLHHFPKGVDWGKGQRVYLAIAIAAKSDEHLSILKQLTKVLSATGVEEALKNCQSKTQLLAILNTQEASPLMLNDALIELDFPVNSLVQLCAVSAGLLKNQDAISKAGVVDVITQKVTYLGQGLWLAKTATSVQKSALAFVTPLKAFKEEGHPVQGLLILAGCDEQHHVNMQCLVDVIYGQEVHKLYQQTKPEIIRLLSEKRQQGLSASFKINNKHGLHTRPSAMLVKIAKQYKAAIQVSNAQGLSVDAKNLMKVISLSVNCGDLLTFHADGIDAQVALDALSVAIDLGLGEE
ncbi:bifunctional PTS system fructose-specific transporter subunit IIA/HPr protein [Psychromonas sp. CNPT3]|uniref:fused PTS fructose transporter subunit IIA/HPr protein n=1 Tax=Psychromonas sp. CNPT3 TaxID=314282 RepID=UPI00006E9CA7|nr:fused PTS fructose transporter subunit IIA/HPr protein [Psychromonas sp. CNPT3]AGH80182.1 bifunctional PTS system fructose-specific transporter subunit IIA/HPr protein [Psychromonas sp. CNPT3]